MTHKQAAMTQFRPRPHTGSFWSHLHALVAHLKGIVKIPTGYQDETGFHLGTEPAKRKIQWPPA